MHALLEPGIAGGLGVEIDRVKCDKAHAFLAQAVRELRRRGVAGSDALQPPPIKCCPVEEVSRCRGGEQDGRAALGAGMLYSSPPPPHANSSSTPPVAPGSLPPPLLPLQMATLDPCTHAYTFWEGVPPDGKAAFGALFAASRTLTSVAVVQRAIRCGVGRPAGRPAGWCTAHVCVGGGGG